jgi:hypothetical protein
MEPLELTLVSPPCCRCISSPFRSSQRILLIGEANFSFAHALADNFLQLHLKELAERLGEEAAETGAASEKGIDGGDDDDDDDDEEDEDEDDRDDSEEDEDEDDSDPMSSSSSAFSSSSAAASSSSSSAVALSSAAAAAAAKAAKSAAADLPDIATRLATARFEYSFTCGARIVATSFDAADIIAQKYADAKEIISKVQMRGVRVLHGIDGTKLHTSPEYALFAVCLLQLEIFIS